MSTSRFDADAHTPYGHCMNCTRILWSEEEAEAHIDESQGPSSKPGVISASHTIAVRNRSRTSRIRYHIEELIDDALREYGSMSGHELQINDDVLDEVIPTLVQESFHRGDYTPDEARETLKSLYEHQILDAYNKEVEGWE